MLQKKRCAFFLERMEDVPLEDFKPTNDPHTTELEEAQLLKYKARLGTTIEIMKLHFVSQAGWDIIENPSATLSHIALYEKLTQHDNNYLLKVKAVVPGRASRYAHVIRDHEEHTRKAWDTNIVSCKEYETYKADESDIVVVGSVWKSLHPLLFADRHVFGILTSVYNEDLQTYAMYFCSEEHLRFKGQGGAAATAAAALGVILRKISQNETEITMVLKVDPKVSSFAPMSFMFVQTYKEEMRKRVALFEQVVQAWDKYYGPSKDPKRVENRR